MSYYFFSNKGKLLNGVHDQANPPPCLFILLCQNHFLGNTYPFPLPCFFCYFFFTSLMTLYFGFYLPDHSVKTKISSMTKLHPPGHHLVYFQSFILASFSFFWTTRYFPSVFGFRTGSPFCLNLALVLGDGLNKKKSKINVLRP